MKFKRVNGFTISTEIDNKIYYIFKDYGTFGNKAYYGIEVDGKVIHHGSTTQKGAKNILKQLLNKLTN